MGYSGLATGYPGCRHHGIFRTYSTYIYLAPLHVPFLRPTYTHTCVRRTLLLSKKRKRKIGKGNRGNKRERERRKMEERKGEKREDASLQGSSRSATYGNVIRAFRWMLSCVFALLRNHVVLPSRSLSSSLFSFLSFLSFPCLPSRCTLTCLRASLPSSTKRIDVNANAPLYSPFLLRFRLVPRDIGNSCLRR